MIPKRLTFKYVDIIVASTDGDTFALNQFLFFSTTSANLNSIDEMTVSNGHSS